VVTGWVSKGGSYDVESEEEGACRGDEDEVDEIPRQILCCVL